MDIRDNKTPRYTWFENQLRQGKVLYLNKEKSAAWASETSKSSSTRTAVTPGFQEPATTARRDTPAHSEPALTTSSRLSSALDVYTLTHTGEPVKPEVDLEKFYNQYPDRYSAGEQTHTYTTEELEQQTVKPGKKSIHVVGLCCFR